MYAVYTQFIRNFFCVLKSLLPREAWLLQKGFLAGFFILLRSVSNIEYIIALTQALAAIFNIYTGISNYFSGERNIKRFRKILDELDELSLADSSYTGMHFTVLRHGIRKDLLRAQGKIFFGITNVSIGIAFIFLTTGSLHIHLANHPKSIIDALLIMEIGLVYLLHCMWDGLMSRWDNYYKYDAIIGHLQESQKKTITGSDFLNVTLSEGYLANLMEAYTLLNDRFIPRYKVVPHDDIQSLHYDLQDIQKYIGKSDKSQNKVDVREMIEKLESLKKDNYFNFYLEFVYLLLNFTAGYGYLLGILVFYLPNASLTSSSVPEKIAKYLMFGMNNSDADFYGNLAGDIAWTIEPLLIMSAPILRKIFLPKVGISICIYSYFIYTHL